MTTDEILAAVEPQIRYQAKKLARRCPESGLDADDLAQEARAAVLRGADGYDPAKAKPVYYFMRRIHGAMVDAIRNASFAPRLAVQRGEPLVKVSTFSVLDRRAYRDDESGYDKRVHRRMTTIRFDPAHHDPEPADDAETEFLAFLRRLCGGLSAREWSIMRWYYVREWTMKDIGDRLGLCEARVSQIHTAVMAKLGRVGVPA